MHRQLELYQFFNTDKSHFFYDLLNVMNFYPIYCLFFLESQFGIPLVLGIERKSFFDSPYGELKKIEVKARPHFMWISPPKMREHPNFYLILNKSVTL